MKLSNLNILAQAIPKNYASFLRILVLVLCCIGGVDAQEKGLLEKSLKEEVLIFPLQDKHVHGSSLVELKNGNWLAVWFQGSGERTADDVLIMGATCQKGKGQWSKPFIMADTPGIPDCNPVVFINDQGKLFLVWIAVLANRWEQSVLRVKTAKDYTGHGLPKWNWQDNIFLKPGGEFAQAVDQQLSALPKSTGGWAEYARPYDEQIISAAKDPSKRSIGWMTRIKPLMEGSRIILPLYSDGFNFSMMAISEDDGMTWSPSLPIVGRGAIQPALARRKNGDILALMRDSGDAPARVHQSISMDNGHTWTASTKTAIPNTASVEMIKWDEGHWLFLGNDIVDGRYLLTLYVSEDEGASWTALGKVEYDRMKRGKFSYPSMLRGADDLLHITYSYHLSDDKKSIKYIVLDPALHF
ncbi:exo-alpha-sialidase [Echinicola soli]|uniref:Exo-alpha-sialidase n=1 Tax=Echinicola soli TaxID=2591634 RepID=A0A514CLE8_9BACT|nr:sialidase family protein [Echinicola soli]QDH80524.1 exo-alpha-sialidase [Echinicola soli]